MEIGNSTQTLLSRRVREIDIARNNLRLLEDDLQAHFTCDEEPGSTEQFRPWASGLAGPVVLAPN